MKFFKKNSGMLLAILIFAAVMMAYNYWFKVEEIVQSEDVAAVGGDLIALSETLQTVTLSTSLFSKPAYTLLKDFSTPLTPQPLGRSNPFDPIGR